MREVVLDTETTGFARGRNVAEGHRIIEVACVEIIDNEITGREFHAYVNPRRGVQAGAFKIHRISDEFLKDKVGFEDVVSDLISFIGDSVIVCHNAPFDLKFLDQEFMLLDVSKQPEQLFKFFDTLEFARHLFPSEPNSLDALARRFKVPGRIDAHGALVDAKILASVYLSLKQWSTFSRRTFELN